jgi:aminoglycoside 6'-N-acetyltransferase I
MQTVTIRFAAPQDRDQWLILRRELWPDCPEHKHQLEIDQMLSSRGVVVMAEHNEIGMVGFAEISIRHDHVEGASINPIPYLEGWFVNERFRRKGIGRRLISAAEEWAKHQGFTEFASDADIGNRDSITIHSTLGFKEVGRSVHFLKSLVQKSPTNEM